ncbi:MAG: glycosyltransferase [Burkholderiales bacterium]|nr:glycosyltransferase [Burkholderiales bacterium]
MPARVLQLCPFDIPDAPTSGGQIRIAEIARAYRARGCDVDRSCVVTRSRDMRRHLDVRMSWWDRTRRKHLGKPSNLGQIRQHWSAVNGGSLARQLSQKLHGHYDVLQVEHPWDFALARQLRSHPALSRAVVVYSSHNIESEFFESVLKERSQWNVAAVRLRQEIEQLEREASSGADIVWAVTQHDLEFFSRSAAACVLAPNGCRELPSQPPPSAFTALQGRYALFVATGGSANVNGFVSMLGGDLSFLPPGTAIHTVGSCGEPLAQLFPSSKVRGTLVHHGVVDQATLDSALLNAGVILLPIRSGGGSNLKTAEALASGRPVIGTRHAFRGYEDWARLPGVYIADDPQTFRTAIARSLDAALPPHLPPPGPRPSLAWSQTLAAAVERTLGLIPTRS